MTPDVAMAAPAFPGRRPGAAVPDAGMDDDGKVLEASVRDPDRFTMIFDRYFGQVHSYVARRLGPDIAYGTVCSRLSRARRTLRATLEDPS